MQSLPIWPTSRNVWDKYVVKSYPVVILCYNIPKRLAYIPIPIFFFFFLFYLFLLVGGWLRYNRVLPYIDLNQPWIYMCSPSQSPIPRPSPSNPSGSSQCTSPEHLSHASNLGWWSVSPLIVYLFQCYSLRTSHPRLLPQSPKVCSVHLCLFICFAYRVIVTIF